MVVVISTFGYQSSLLVVVVISTFVLGIFTSGGGNYIKIWLGISTSGGGSYIKIWLGIFTSGGGSYIKIWLGIFLTVLRKILTEPKSCGNLHNRLETVC